MTMPPEGVPAEPPDADELDALYQQLQAQARTLEGQVDRLGQMLRQAALSGTDHAAKAWLSEFRQIAIEIKSEQDLVHKLLQGMHGLTAYALHQAEEAYAAAGWQEDSGGSPGPQTGGSGTASAPSSAGGFSVGTLPGQSTSQVVGGGYAQAHAQSSTDWMSGPIPGGPADGPPGVANQPKGRAMLRKLGTGAAAAAGTLGIFHSPGYGSYGRAGGAYGRGGSSSSSSRSPLQRRGGLFGNQAAQRDDDMVADDAVDDSYRVGGQQRAGTPLERFMRGNLGRSVRGRDGYGMQQDTIRRMW